MTVANPSTHNRSKTGASSTCEILIFAKAPTPGRCKTRLARSLGNRRAARLYRSMLGMAVDQACALDDAAVTLVCAPDTRHPLFAHLRRRYGVRLVRQSRGSLGERMHHALRLAARRADRVILMGSDQPVAIIKALSEGRHALDSYPAWLAPTHDGGYWAIGLERPDSRIFRGPPWSTDRVTTTTLTACRRLGWRPALHAPARDIDDARDWARLPITVRSAIARNATMPGLAGK